MRFSSRCFTARVVSCEMSPHRVAGSLTSRHRSRRVKSVSAFTLAMGCISLLRLGGLSFGVGYALLFAGPFYTIHRTLPSSAADHRASARCGHSRHTSVEVTHGGGAAET